MAIDFFQDILKHLSAELKPAQCPVNQLRIIKTKSQAQYIDRYRWQNRNPSSNTKLKISKSWNNRKSICRPNRLQHQKTRQHQQL